MKPVFRIARLGAQDKVLTVDTYLTKDILDDIANRINGSTDYDVIWLEKRIEGRMITFETNDEVNFINLSQNGVLRSRNNQLQSVPTALAIYLNEQRKIKKKKTNFYFYFMPQIGNNKTDYLEFFYRVMKTAGIKFLNLEFGLPDFVPTPFFSVKDIIHARNDLRSRNTGNQSTYVTDEGEFYHIYGKTFGANQKETALLCIAISAITDKPIKLFQILDNDSVKLSDNDVDAINIYVAKFSKHSFDIMDDTLQFDNDSSDTVRDNLRSPKFIYNLLSKFDGEKRCALCGCKIESIIQAAHIYPVSEIRRNNSLPDEKKFELAIDKDNGIWLCENHHKLFDRGLIWFEEGKLCISKRIDEDDIAFVEQITTIEEIEPCYINDRMLAFFDMRAGIPPRVVL